MAAVWHRKQNNSYVRILRERHTELYIAKLLANQLIVHKQACARFGLSELKHLYTVALSALHMMSAIHTMTNHW